jgi:hypothetical protein
VTIPEFYGQVTFTYSGSGVPLGAANTLGFANPTGKSAFAACTDLRTAWEARIMPQLVQNTGLDDVIVKLGPDETGPMAVQASGVAGSVLTPQASSNTAYLIQKLTAGGGRRNRGRLYLPGVSEASIDQAGNVLAATTTALNAAFLLFLGDMSADDLPAHLLHEPGRVRTVTYVETGPAPVPTPITGFSASASAATQRRRMRD